MKIHEYNEMMAYLLRPATGDREKFAEGSGNFTPGFGGGVEAQKKGTAASVAAFKAREVDRIRPTFYDGELNIKGPQKLIDQYKIDFEKRLQFPKGGTEYKKAIALGDILSDAELAKKYDITLGDVERINRVVKKDLGEYKVPDKKRYKTGQIRREELEKVTDLGLEQEYTKLKKGERIGNPDLAHRVSKKYNVTTSNLGLDNPLINRVIVKPNERDISRLYDKRIKIENKYKLKDGTFKKPSNQDIKILEKINNNVETLARETKGRLSAIVNDPKNLNKPYGSLGVDPSKTIGGGIIDVDLKDVRKLSLEDQAFLKLNLQELKEKELGKTPKMLADEYKDILKKPDVQKRIKNIVNKGNMEKVYINQAKQLLNFSNIPSLTTADKIPTPEKTKTREMFEAANNRLSANPFFDPQVLKQGALDTLKVLGTPTVAAGFAGSTIKKNLDEGQNFLDAATDKMVGVDLLYPEVAKQTVGRFAKPTGKGILSTLGRVAMNPFGRAARAFTPVGAGITAIGLGKDYYDFAKDEIAKVKAMSPEERNFYNDLLMDEGGLLDW